MIAFHNIPCSGKRMLSVWFCLFILITAKISHSAAATVQDAFRLATYYSDHMVLQRGPDSAVIWGYAVKGAQITVLFKDTKYSTTANAASFTTEGVWQVTLDPQPPSGPFTIKVTSNNQGVQEVIQLQDVLFGDVWVCSGQSNMAFDVKSAFNGTEALQESYQYNLIRVLAVSEVESNVPLYDLQSLYQPWSLPNPDSLGGQNTNFELYFSAVCWFFGRDLYEHLKHPIGLISTNWGGTPAEAWSSPEVLKTCNISSPDRKEDSDRFGNQVKLNKTSPSSMEKTYIGNVSHLVGGPQGHSVLWNAMIHPLLNMSIKGAIWYQGEDNAVHGPSTYNCLFPQMIVSWRKQWYSGTGGVMNPQFPFGFVQLCNSEHPGNANFTSLRWHQTADYGYVPNPLMPDVFMAVAIDLPDLKSPHGPVHPRDKEDVSARLLLGARAVAYGENYTTFQGPFPSNISHLAPASLLLQFDQGKAKLKMNNKDGFDVCCASSFNDCPIQGNTSWVPTNIMNLFDNATIFIEDPCPSLSMAVRYIWADLPCLFKDCPLYDAVSQLPVPPFFLPVKRPDENKRAPEIEIN
ncbi:sialate O-acetylesterase isoform X1 [Strongylocentrotus purpuratus]|uniref:Sialate O-acetylesterase n=1 Tax=Strongylocentrotus purpuratus TaxID=7668 RepID=A0A7M7GHZ2_STRPU|nr:sialate O-acetylesterase isoform X1 [Strongylocentrotus purpuratus]